MPTGLDKTALKNEFLTILTDMRTRTADADEEFATRWSDAIDTYVKGAIIKYNDGLTAPNGPVAGTFNGQLE